MFLIPQTPFVYNSICVNISNLFKTGNILSTTDFSLWFAVSYHYPAFIYDEN